MAACISNSNNKQKDSGIHPIARSSCSLERLASLLLKGHPALPVVAGNSGNMADVRSNPIWRMNPADHDPFNKGQVGMFLSQ